MEALIEFLGKILGKIFGTANERALRRYWRIVREEINPLEEKVRALPDSAFPDMTQRFREEYRRGKSLDEILPEAFAAVREAARRKTLRNMRHFDVQLIGGIVLHEGNIAEMATGEGKTLVATAPLYLNALPGRGVHLVTVNDYLARRDVQWMGPVYHLLGMKVGCLNHDASYLYDPEYNPGPLGGTHCLRPCEKKEAYLADITYGTNSEFGFDYLRDNMKIRKEDQCQRGHVYAIVDEVDSILIDEARTPHIISGPANEAKNEYYRKADQVARLLRKGEDYTVDEKKHIVVLTDAGIERAQRFLGVDNFYTGEHMDWPHYIEQAIKAHELYKKDREYVVQEGEVIIVDEFTGRLMPGRRWSDGLHEAVETKEGIALRRESQTLATVTLQNYFRLYEKLAGMTGTAATEAAEFDKIYKMGVVVIPTHKPMRRTLLPDVVFASEEEKFEYVADEIERIHDTGRPVLVGTTSIAKSEYLSKLLKIRGVPHEVLNAKHHEKEAYIIERAGQRGQVTISTNMAGRGTDILLGEGVAELGGLHIIGTERHEARRIDNQLRGRAARQGDPGSAQFFLSLDDDLFRKFAPPWFKGFMQKMGLQGGERIESRMVSRAIEKAQKNVENYNFEIRKSLLEYDELMDRQRKHVYALRQKLLEGESMRADILERIARNVAANVEKFLPEADLDSWDWEGLVNWIRGRIGGELSAQDLQKTRRHLLVQEIQEKFRAAYEARVSQFGDKLWSELERVVLLDSIDERWKDHLYNMDQLRDLIGLRGYAQVDPKLEYKREGTTLFQEMMEGLDDDVCRLLFKLMPVKVGEDERAQKRMESRWKIEEYKHESVQTIGAGAVGQAGQNGQEEQKIKPIVSGPKIGRNDPCPCRSGKKYKRCCGLKVAGGR